MKLLRVKVRLPPKRKSRSGYPVDPNPIERRRLLVFYRDEAGNLRGATTPYIHEKDLLNDVV